MYTCQLSITESYRHKPHWWHKEELKHSPKPHYWWTWLKSGHHASRQAKAKLGWLVLAPFAWRTLPILNLESIALPWVPGCCSWIFCGWIFWGWIFEVELFAVEFFAVEFFAVEYFNVELFAVEFFAVEFFAVEYFNVEKHSDTSFQMHKYSVLEIQSLFSFKIRWHRFTSIEGGL